MPRGSGRKEAEQLKIELQVCRLSTLAFVPLTTISQALPIYLCRLEAMPKMSNQPSTQPKGKESSPPTTECASQSPAARTGSPTEGATSQPLPATRPPRLRSFYAEAITAFNNCGASSSGASKASSSAKGKQPAHKSTSKSAVPTFKLVILPPLMPTDKDCGGQAVPKSDGDAVPEKKEKAAKSKAREELDGKDLVKDILDELLEEDASKRIMTFKPIPAEEIEEAEKLPLFPSEYDWSVTDDEVDSKDYDKDQWERIQRGRQVSRCVRLLDTTHTLTPPPTTTCAHSSASNATSGRRSTPAPGPPTGTSSRPKPGSWNANITSTMLT